MGLLFRMMGDLLDAVFPDPALKEARTEAAATLGLGYDGKDSIEGSAHRAGHDYPVHVEFGAPRRDDFSKVMVRGFSRDFLLNRNDGVAGAIGEAVFGREMEIGDAEFDRRVRVEGSELKARSLLGASARARVLSHLAKPHAAFERGAVTLQVPDARFTAAEIVQTVESLLQVAELLDDRTSLAALLVDNARDDPEPMVRVRCLEMLQKEYPDQREAQDEFSNALQDADPRVRLTAAAFLVGGQTILALSERVIAQARLVLRSLSYAHQVDASVRTRALDVFKASGPPDAAAEVANDLLRDADPAVRTAAIRIVGQMGPPQFAARLEALAPAIVNARGPEAVALATALGTIGQPSSETALLALLATDDLPVKVAAALALGVCGSVRAVEPLHAASKSVGLLDSGDLKDAVEAAVKRIQLDVRGAEAGQLSMAAPGGVGGELSVPDQPGGLSLPDSGKPAKG